MVVMAEEYLHMGKSKPVLVAARGIWGAIEWVYVQQGLPDIAQQVFRHSLIEYAELWLFLSVAVTYIS